MTESEIAPWPGDHFSRELLAKRLIPVIASMKHGGVIGLDAPFGYGKTFFVKGLAAQLRAEGFNTAYFDAWKGDLTVHPLFLFVSEILTQLAEQGVKVEGNADLGSKIGALSSAVARIGAKTVLRAGDEDLDALLDPFVSEVDRLDFSKKGAAAEAKKLVDQVEAARSAFAAAVSSLIKKSEKPLFIVIDELDRARPDFSIELLEALKFVFMTDGVIFCVSADRENMTHVVRAKFGADYAVDQYLAKLFNFWVRLDNPIRPTEFFSSQVRAAGLVRDELLSESDDIFSGVSAMAEFGLSGLGKLASNPRAVQRCVERAAICTRILGRSQPWSCVVGLLCGLSVAEETTLRRYVAHNIEDFRPGASYFEFVKQHLVLPSDWHTAMALAFAIPPNYDSSGGITHVYGTGMASQVSDFHRTLVSRRRLSSRSAARLVFEEAGWALG